MKAIKNLRTALEAIRQIPYSEAQAEAEVEILLALDKLGDSQPLETEIIKMAQSWK